VRPALPRWADLILIPGLNLVLAFLVAGLVVVFIGEDPIRAVQVLIQGSLGSSYGIGFTLYYATTFVFTGLAVAIAFHASLFNIGGEGQAALGGLGVALVCLAVDWPHWALALPAAVIGAAAFGGAWAFLPGYLQAKRGSHVVITTIMFNFIASALWSISWSTCSRCRAPWRRRPRTSPKARSSPSCTRCSAPSASPCRARR
jgi:simple sugar transport system permease protein